MESLMPSPTSASWDLAIVLAVPEMESSTCQSGITWSAQLGNLPDRLLLFPKESDFAVTSLLFCLVSLPFPCSRLPARSLSLHTAPQSSFLSARLDAAPFMDHWMKSIKSFKIYSGEFCFVTVPICVSLLKCQNQVHFFPRIVWWRRCNP